MKLSTAALLGALLLPLAACDSTDEADLADADIEAVATVASALSVESGGALDDVAFALGGEGYADARGPGHGGHGWDAGAGACVTDTSYDPDTGGVTRTVSCERGEPGDPRYHTSTRSLVAFFVDADGEALPGPDGAVSATFEILEGTSLSTAPRRSRAITETTGSGELTGLDTDELTGNASGSRSGTYDVERRDGLTRAASYTVTLDLANLTGPTPARLAPILFQGRWRRATSGTATGVYAAEVTTTRPNGATVTRTVERPFEITFPLDGEGQGRIRMDGGEHRVDLGTGAVL